ncbi:MAG: hypothetical protein H7Y37_20755 [Anaerolineae bacterium]|nr:hypothetical protein [Gloeobacterales cyanobacterium ES-bin-313]
MANGTKGKGRAPPSGLPPRGGQKPVPHTPLATLVAWYSVLLGCAGFLARCGRVRNQHSLWTGGTVGITLRVPGPWRYAW